MDVAAHVPDKPGQALQIGNRTYSKGLGHHANGKIVVLLDGRYASFDAEVGLQPCGGGSVVFRVLVDGECRFESGLLRSGDGPKAVHLELKGAQELILDAQDGGDGISCDMANWAEARLTPAPESGSSRPQSAGLDMAPFARAVTWDPGRTNGARASRIEEFRAEDVFTETELKGHGDGWYRIPLPTNGRACVGLQWLNRRALRELALEFATIAQLPEPGAIGVEAWSGESAWQGNWKPVAGELRFEGPRVSFRPTSRGGPLQTQKVRWVLPSSAVGASVRLQAFTYSRWESANLRVELDRPKAGRGFKVGVDNGGLESLEPAPGDKSTRAWNLQVRYSRPSSLNADPTVLRFQLRNGEAAVAVADVLSNACVYLPDYGLFVARRSAPVLTLADYKRRIAGRRTILEEVRMLPDQTRVQAMARTHHEAQREGPVMLSLACDNAKFVVERDGRVLFQASTNAANDWFGSAWELRPGLGGPATKLERTLDGGWLPIPIITREKEGVVYRQRVFVAPCDAAGGNPTRLNRRAVCVVEITITNTLDRAANALLELALSDRTDTKGVLRFTPCQRGFLVSGDGAPFALAETAGLGPLTALTNGGGLPISGALPAHRSAGVVLFLSGQGLEFEALPDAGSLLAAAEGYWRAVLTPAMQVETPDPLLNNLVRSSQVRCLIAARNEADGARVAPWIAAMSYGPLESEAHSVIRGMDFMGHSDFARRSLDFFIHRYNTNGFLTTGYTTFGTAWHLWTLGEHCQLTRDQAWLRQNASEIARVGHWIIRQTEKTQRPDVEGRPAPEFGLVPPGVLADWNAFAFHFAMNGYYCAALREAGRALAGAGHPDAALFLKEADELRANTLRAYRWTQSRAPALALRDGTWIPHYPSQVHSPGRLAEFFPGQDAGRSWCYDVELGAHQLVAAGVLDPGSRETARMMDHMEDVQFLADGWFDYPAASNQADWFNLGGFSKVQPYYTRNAEVYALRDDVKPFVRSYFNTIAAMVNPEVLTMWEHFHHSGAWDKTHETGYFLHQTRTMLVQERGEELWLAPFVTDRWLEDGLRVSVKQAPTRFGPVNFEIVSHVAQGSIEAAIDPPTREKPSRIVLRLRHPGGNPIRGVTVNGRRHSAVDRENGLIRLRPTRGPIVIRVTY